MEPGTEVVVSHACSKMLCAISETVIYVSVFVKFICVPWTALTRRVGRCGEPVECGAGARPRRVFLLHRLALHGAEQGRDLGRPEGTPRASHFKRMKRCTV